VCKAIRLLGGSTGRGGVMAVDASLGSLGSGTTNTSGGGNSAGVCAMFKRCMMRCMSSSDNWSVMFTFSWRSANFLSVSGIAKSFALVWSGVDSSRIARNAIVSASVHNRSSDVLLLILGPLRPLTPTMERLYHHSKWIESKKASLCKRWPSPPLLG